MSDKTEKIKRNVQGVRKSFDAIREGLGIPERILWREKIGNFQRQRFSPEEQQAQPQRSQPTRVIMVNEKGEFVGEVPQENTPSPMEPQPQTQSQIPAPPSTSRQTFQPSVQEKLMNFQGGGLMKNFQERPIRKSLGGLIDSISSNIRSQPQQQNIPKQRPQSQKEEPKKTQSPEISFELDGQKSKDKRSEHSINIED